MASRLKRLEKTQGDTKAQEMMNNLDANKKLLNIFRGMANSPAVLDGYGPIPASMARRLVAQGADCADFGGDAHKMGFDALQETFTGHGRSHVAGRAGEETDAKAFL